jgi:hypothetical protein
MNADIIALANAEITIEHRGAIGETGDALAVIML